MGSLGAALSSDDAVVRIIEQTLDKQWTALNLNGSFVENGGSSMSAVRLKTLLLSLGISVPLLSLFENDTILSLAASWSRSATVSTTITPQNTIEECNNSKTTDMDNHENNEMPTNTTSLNRYISQQPNPTGNSYLTTEIQHQFIKSSSKSSNRNTIVYFETHDPKNVPTLKSAWEQVLQSEDIFKYSFEIQKNQAYMREHSHMNFIWDEWTTSDRNVYAQMVADAAQSYKPMIGTQFKVITLEQRDGDDDNIDEESTIIWYVHHALIDGDSYSMIRSKVRDITNGKLVAAGSSFGSFADQLLSLQQRGSDIATEFWAKKADQHPQAPGQIILPSPQTKGSKRASSILQQYKQVSATYNTQHLANVATKAGVTPAMILYTAWGITTARYSSSDCVSVGIVLSGRYLPIPSAQDTIGPVINTLPLIISLDRTKSITDLLHIIKRDILELMEYQWSIPSHGFSRDFNSVINVHAAKPNWTGQGCDPIKKPYHKIQSDFPLSIDVEADGTINVNYDGTVFFDEDMQNMVDSFVAALHSPFLSTINKPVSSWVQDAISDQQLQRMAQQGNWNLDSTRVCSINETLVSLFTNIAALYPDAVALEHTFRALTYRQLDEQSTHIAQHLSKIVGPGEVVCVDADGTIDWIIAAYAVLKCAAIYCPLPPSLPEALKATNAQTAKAKVYVTTHRNAARLSCFEYSFSVIELLESQQQLNQQDMNKQDQQLSSLTAASPAYLCFTSGSSGKPKGVVCTHGSLVAFQKDFDVRLQSGPGCRISQFMSPSFDGSIHEIFSALSYGSTLVLKDDLKPFDVFRRVDSAIMTPSIAQILEPSEFPRLKSLYLVGEAVPQQVCDMWATPNRQLFNMYGPTECTGGATIKQLFAKDTVTLGQPNPSSRIYLLDSNLMVVPLGVIGDIYIAGIQVAVGYIGRDDETAKRFLPDSINPQYKDERMYWTGDRAYWNHQGELVYLGRGDRQIKLKGFRMDLDDVEVRMAKADKNCRAVALLSLMAGTPQHHIAAVVQPADIDLNLFQANMRQSIPAYMIPQHVVAMDTFPRTPVGKLDFKAIGHILASAQNELVSKKSTVASKSLNDVAMEAIRHVLGIAADGGELDLDADIREHGSDSMLALRLSSRLSWALEQQIPVHVILSSPSLRKLLLSLAATVAKASKVSRPPVGSVLGRSRLSPMEAEWWHKYQRPNGTAAFNVSYACSFDETIDQRRLQLSWNYVLRRHDLLRCRYRQLPSTKKLTRQFSDRFPVVQLTKDNLEVHQQVNTPFDMHGSNGTDGDLIRVLISPTKMVLVISHILCDMTTLRLLLAEVANLYQGRLLPPVHQSYFETTWFQPTDTETLTFWDNYLEPNLCSGFLTDKPRISWEGTSTTFNISPNICDKMRQFSLDQGFTMHQIVLAAVAMTLQPERDNCDITIGAPYLARTSEPDMTVIGLFLEPLPIRVAYDDSNQTQTQKHPFLTQVQQSSQAALSHTVPRDQLLEHLGIDPTDPENGLFDVVVSFHEQEQVANILLPGTSFIPTNGQGAKFKLMVEFTACEYGDITARMEYSTEIFDSVKISQLFQSLEVALEGLINGKNYSEIRGKLQH